MRCKWLSLVTITGPGVSMCTACSRSTSLMLALMNSADHFPSLVIALKALCSPGFVRPGLTGPPSLMDYPCTAGGVDRGHARCCVDVVARHDRSGNACCLVGVRDLRRPIGKKLRRPMPPSFSLPPELCGRGGRPSLAANCRSDRNIVAPGTAAMDKAVIGPIPGMVGFVESHFQNGARVPLPIRRRGIEITSRVREKSLTTMAVSFPRCTRKSSRK